MSNIKVKGRVFRNIEKMNLEQLGEVRRYLTDAISNHNKTGMKLMAGAQNAGVMAQIERMDAEVQQWGRRLKTIEALAKQAIEKIEPDQLAKQIAARHGQTPTVPTGA